jgi:hypothetical protein
LRREEDFSAPLKGFALPSNIKKVGLSSYVIEPFSRLLKKALQNRKRTLKGAATFRNINALCFGGRRLQPAENGFSTAV